MLALNTLLRELKKVPLNRLEDLYSIIHSLGTDPKKPEGRSEEILSFAGTFSGMSEREYQDFRQHTEATRKDLFDREIEL